MIKNIINHLKIKHQKISKTIRNNLLINQKLFENPNSFDKKSLITEHIKTSLKLSKTIIKGEKVSSNSPLYSSKK